MDPLTLPLRTEPAARSALLDLAPDPLLAWLAARAQPPLRARQLRRWVVAGRATSFEQMTDLPRGLRTELAAELVPLGTRVQRDLTSSDGTHKLLVGLRDGQVVECVLMQEADRRTVCVS